MGLDMYLYKDTYVGANWHEDEELIGIDNNIKVGRRALTINARRVAYIREQVAYWRKANAIHAWFVNNCQDGVDECQQAYVSVENLQELLGICKQVLENPKLADVLLPTREGFFFGGTEYDDWYKDDLACTVVMLEQILSEDTGDSSYYYQSSW